MNEATGNNFLCITIIFRYENHNKYFRESKLITSRNADVQNLIIISSYTLACACGSILASHFITLFVEFSNNLL